VTKLAQRLGGSALGAAVVGPGTGRTSGKRGGLIGRDKDVLCG